MAELEVELGRLHWGGFRDIVSELKWRGHNIDMFEGSGFLSRRFVVRGDERAVRYVRDCVADCVADCARRQEAAS